MFSSYSYAGMSDFYALEDYLGNTIIIYKDKDVHLLKVDTGADSIISNYYYNVGPEGESFSSECNGVRFWEKNPQLFMKLIHSRSFFQGENYYIKHYSYGEVFNDKLSLKEIFISQLNDNIVYVNKQYAGYGYSSDGGYHWQDKNPGFALRSVSRYDLNKLFGIESSSGYVVMSLDNGETYFPVISSKFYYTSYQQFYYDIDRTTIYFLDSYNNSTLRKSSDVGYTWNIIYTNQQIGCRICLDESNSGVVYLANFNKIYLSTDYGLTFTYYRSISGSIEYLYKKPGSDRLYACTGSNIYQISPDSIIIIKITPTSTPDKDTNYKPDNILLKQNYPNPFNPSTSIEFQIPNSNFVTLEIYNLLGQKMVTLVNEKLNTGTYTALWNAAGFASGVYLYRLQAGNYSETKKLILKK